MNNVIKHILLKKYIEVNRICNMNVEYNKKWYDTEYKKV